jgi:hypothetical protein
VGTEYCNVLKTSHVSVCVHELMSCRVSIVCTCTALHLRRYQSGQPYPHILIEDLMHSDFLALVKEELSQETFLEKANDLYDFTQSHDLRASTAPASTLLREALYGARFREFLTAMTGIALNDHIDISSAIYRDTDKLLCHDDELEGACLAWSRRAMVAVPLDRSDLMWDVALCLLVSVRTTHRIHFVPRAGRLGFRAGWWQFGFVRH